MTGGTCVAGVCMAGGGCVWQGGHVWQGHAWQGGMHGWGHAWQGCVAGGHAWWGVCMAGGMHAMHTPLSPPPPRHYEIQFVNAWTIPILLECILVHDCVD